MENEALTFEQIIATISDREMMTDYKYKKRQQITEDNNASISPETQRFYLAFYARAAAEHVDFENFNRENIEKFKAEIERIYANIHSDKKQGEFLQELGDSTAKYIEDRHFTLDTGNTIFYGGNKKEKRSVGDNFTFQKRKTDYSAYNHQTIGDGYTEIDGQKIPVWSISTMKKGNEDILVISIPNLARQDTYEGWKDFIDTFDDVYLKNKEKWDKGRIIFDVRGNRGGEDKPIDHVARRLYGNALNYYKRCEIKDTSLSNFLLHKHGCFKPKNCERAGISPEDLIQRQNFSGKNVTIFDETSSYYPFNEQTGYRGKIDILIDRDVASSAESAYTSFYHHPNVRYIGENTAGMQQYPQATFTTPWGREMRVAVSKQTFWDKEDENIELKGHKPDVNCSGKDAFNEALSLPIDEGRVIGFREKNEIAHPNNIYKEYDPRDVDERKPYNAKFIDLAIREVEMINSSGVQGRIEKLLKTLQSKSTGDHQNILHDRTKELKESLSHSSPALQVRTINDLRGIGIDKTHKAVKQTTLDVATVKRRTTQNEG